MKNLFSALKQNAFTPSQNFVNMSISLEAKTYSSHIFSQKENSTQSPERTDGRLLCKTNALNKSGSHSASGTSSPRHLYYLFQNSQFPEGKAQFLFPSACPKTLLIPEWGRYS